MHRIGIALLAGCIVASSLVGCVKPPTMSLDSTTVTRGHDVVVRFDKPLAGNVTNLYWIALVPIDSPDPTATSPSETAMAMMIERCCRHLPVLEDGRVVGMVSMGDLVRWTNRNHEHEIQALQEYVSGAPPG